MYKEQLRALLIASERRVLEKLSTPQKIQTYVEKLPLNFESEGDTFNSPRKVLREKAAHCFEGALLAAAALAYHGEPPLLMDLRATGDEDDHVVALFRVGSFWGGISKTNHSVLRYRDAVYKTPRELALSYFHEYTAEDGRKVLREYSLPFDLRRYEPEEWFAAAEKLQWLVDALDASRHYPIAPKKNLRLLRRASKIELDATELVEWRRPEKSKA